MWFTGVGKEGGEEGGGGGRLSNPQTEQWGVDPAVTIVVGSTLLISKSIMCLMLIRFTPCSRRMRTCATCS